MKRFRSAKLSVLVLLSLFVSSILSAAGSFVSTKEGMRYVVTDNAGNITQVVVPQFDPKSDKYYVKNNLNQIIAVQTLTPEADMSQIRLVAPVSGSSSAVSTKDFLGNEVPILSPLAANDPRYIQLKDYIQSNPGLAEVAALQIEARNYKIEKLQNSITQGTRDPEFASWLVNSLEKPIYLEVGNSGSIHHDPRGFVLAESVNGEMTFRDNSHVNRLVIPPDSEAFAGGLEGNSTASIISHELGHMIMDQLYERPNYPKTDYFGPHAKNCVTDEGFALSEGWAEALEALSTRGMRDSDSWRIKTHQNIEDNKYIFENMGIISGPNDGILKSGYDMLSTEGANATLFYDILSSGQIDAPFSKIIQVFESSKPQTYRDFVSSYIEQFPEDRSRMINSFLENTKYATVDSSAGIRYKELHDAQQAYLNATDPSAKSSLYAEYNAKLNEYNQWKDQLYKQTVVDGNIDKSIEGPVSYSQNLDSEYRSVRLDEIFAKANKALNKGMTNAADSLKQSFSVKNVAITAGTAIAFNLANQIISGEKVSMQTAFKSVASLQFVGNVVGSSLGAAAGHVVAPLISAFVPIPVVGTLAGALIPTMTALFGSSFGGNIGSGMTFKQAIKAIDPVALSGQAIGSTLGSILGAMIPIPIVGSIVGGVVGGMLGERVFKGIANLFSRNKNQNIDKIQPLPHPIYFSTQDSHTTSVVATPQISDPYNIKISAEIDNLPYESMSEDLKTLKNYYETAYLEYVDAITSSTQELATIKLKDFTRAKEAYQKALTQQK